jgi:hypothetical protein
MYRTNKTCRTGSSSYFIIFSFIFHCMLVTVVVTSRKKDRIEHVLVYLILSSHTSHRNKKTCRLEIVFVEYHISLCFKQSLSFIFHFIVQYSQRDSMVNHCDRHITLLSDTAIFFALFHLFAYFIVHFG